MTHLGSLLIMIHCEQNTGYAVGKLEEIFFQSALKAGYAEDAIFWSFLKLSGEPQAHTIACDYKDVATHSDLRRLVQQYDIKTVLAFDLGYPSAVCGTLKSLHVKRIISYWGASMSSINKGFKLFAKRVEWYLQSNKPDFFIFESEAMQKTAYLGRGVPKGKTAVVHLGTDTNLFQPHYGQYFYAHEQFDIPNNKKIVFYSGHMEERKGVRVIVQAAIYLSEKLLRNDIHFVICGNKHREADAYIALLEGKQAGANVTFAGYRQDIPDLMRSSCIGVIASTGWDSFTMSSVEMMASGLPMIVSNLQGLCETIIENTNGSFIEPGNFIDLAEKIISLVDDETRAKSMSKASRQLALDRYSTSNQINALANIINQT